MGNGLIALLVAVSAGVWIYTKMMRKTGNNAGSAAAVAGIGAVVIFIVVILLLGLIPG
jgi:uncharacterized membrane protein SpoIIM required for sporulation